jgi:hypothetical protein
MAPPCPRWHAEPMSGAPTASPLLYIDCDVPDGMTLREWRQRRHPARPQSSRVVIALQRAVGLR